MKRIRRMCSLRLTGLNGCPLRFTTQPVMPYRVTFDTQPNAWRW
jgi:hypothetical protein